MAIWSGASFLRNRPVTPEKRRVLHFARQSRSSPLTTDVIDSQVDWPYIV